MKRWVFWAGAAVQIVLFQLIIWALQGGAQHKAMSLTGAALAIGLLMVVFYNLGVSKA